jgi:putative flavoprotein involved in K+ transport
MPSTETLIIGAGQAGLAMSHHLTEAGRDHVILERGRTAERWRSERPDSLRLLSPNWATRLPGWEYRGSDPQGFMSAAELAGYLDAYATSFRAPIEHGSDVAAVRRDYDGYLVRTTATTWRARSVVVATGWCDRPRVPAIAAGLPPSLVQVTPGDYRNPRDLPAGRVLVVGAASSGAQLADELARAGREVVLAVGSHTRLPRQYRGIDIWWWLSEIGSFGVTVDEVSDASKAREGDGLQLIGRSDRRDVDLPSLRRLGVRLTGRLQAIHGRRLAFADDLPATVARSDARLERLRARIDRFVEQSGLTDEVSPADALDRLPAGPPVSSLDLRRDRISAVIWATGYRRSYPWLHVPVLDRQGEILHRRGVTPAPGLYVLGQRFQHRRDSTFIDGVRHDAAFLSAHITGRLDHSEPATT